MKSLQESQRSKIGAIILAAGASSRFGSPKQLLQWKEENFVDTCITVAKQAKLSPIILVLGAVAQPIKSQMRHTQIQVVVNEAWSEGQSTSLKSGLSALLERYPEAFGTFFMLVDQPHTPSNLLEAMKDKAFSGVQIVLPTVDGQFTNPVYFSQACFDDLMTIKGDQGGRAIFSKYQVETVPWQDRGQARDIDTPQDYAELRALYGINDTHLV